MYTVGKKHNIPQRASAKTPAAGHLGLGQRIRRRRQALGLSQEALSSLCGISQRSWSQYETGRWIPRADRLLAIAQTLEVSVDELLGAGEANRG